MRRPRTVRASLCALAVASAIGVLGAGGTTGSAAAAEPGVVVMSFGDVPGTVSRVQAAGARHVRLFVSWRTLELQPGTLGPDLATYDQLIDRLRAVGIGTYLVVHQTPTWAAAGGAADTPPPAAPYADFLRRLAAHFRGRVLAYEAWNEPDFPTFWRGGASPAEYAALLRLAYAGVKAGDPGAKLGIGGLVGNDYSYLSALYDQGAKGSFDFVGVHTDTDCLRTDPRQAIRDVDGRVSRGSFTGYREIRQTMLDHGDDKPIWITELGWSTTGDRCPVNAAVPAGVSPSDQATFLRRAYACLAADPYVQMGTWFSLADAGQEDTIATRFGLMTYGGSRRPAFAAFQGARRVTPDRSCGIGVDRTPPRVSIVFPRDGQARSATLYYRASARDTGRVVKLTLLVDGRPIRVTGKGRLRGRWRGWGDLPNGPHAVRVQAMDRARNVSSAGLTVNKVPFGFGEPVRTRISLKLYGGGGNRLAGAALYTRPRRARAATQGQLVLTWQRRSGAGWTSVGPPVTGPLTATLRSRRHLPRGRYRVVARYAGFHSFRRAAAARGFRVG